METIINLVNFVKSHLQDIILIVTSVVTIASVIVKLTPTQADDAVLAKVMPWIEKLALNRKA
jgi:hypothetical protein